MKSTPASRAHDYLRDFGIRPSAQRVAVMSYLQTHRNHPTVDTIYEDLQPRMPSLSRTTVYNTLRVLVRSGAVQALEIEPGVTRYDGDLTPHAHLLCKRCGGVFDVWVPELPEAFRQAVPGAAIDQIHLYYKGTCPNCR